MRKTDDQELLERLNNRVEQLIRTQGLASLRMDDLARDLGVSKKTIYRVVDSKDALVEAFIQRFVIGIRQSMMTLVEDQSIPFEEKLPAYFEVISTSLQRLNSSMFIDLERFYPKLFDKVEQIRREIIPKMISRLLEEGQSHGRLRKDLDIRFISEAFLQAVQGLFRADSLSIHGLQPHEIPLRLGRLFTEGIRTEVTPQKTDHHTTA